MDILTVRSLHIIILPLIKKRTVALSELFKEEVDIYILTCTYHYCHFFQSWDAYFRQVQNGMPPGQAYQPPPILGQMAGMVATRQTVPSAVDQSTINSLVSDHLAVYSLIRCYQVIILLIMYQSRVLFRRHDALASWPVHSTL